jgi:hypothetical protein
MSELSPLLGVKRKLDCGAVRAAFDPLADFALGRLGCRRRSHLAPSAVGTGTFSSLNDLLPGLRKMRGIHEPSLGERRVPYGRDHECHFPDRGRAFHFDWNALKGALDLGNAQLMRGLGLRKLDG